MLWLIRIVFFGKLFILGGVFEIVVILGKEELLKRMYKGIEFLKVNL